VSASRINGRILPLPFRIPAANEPMPCVHRVDLSTLLMDALQNPCMHASPPPWRCNSDAVPRPRAILKALRFASRTTDPAFLAKLAQLFHKRNDSQPHSASEQAPKQQSLLFLPVHLSNAMAQRGDPHTLWPHFDLTVYAAQDHRNCEVLNTISFDRFRQGVADLDKQVCFCYRRLRATSTHDTSTAIRLL
jgi:hypothetical protein